jgi:hypothetical protein
MAMSVEDRIAKASAARIRSARRKRFKRYAEEMEMHSYDVPGELLALAVENLRASGWTVNPPRPVDESKELATTQPTRR